MEQFEEDLFRMAVLADAQGWEVVSRYGSEVMDTDDWYNLWLSRGARQVQATLRRSIRYGGNKTLHRGVHIVYTDPAKAECHVLVRREWSSLAMTYLPLLSGVVYTHPEPGACAGLIWDHETRLVKACRPNQEHLLATLSEFRPDLSWADATADQQLIGYLMAHMPPVGLNG
ncbi:MAG TPA: hypothetical protein VJM32_04625 [Candidatus Saccharimonadales bacterium]|nr:hypothetical protein [Candidatus Saccharimonadales bacterium]